MSRRPGRPRIRGPSPPPTETPPLIPAVSSASSTPSQAPRRRRTSVDYRHKLEVVEFFFAHDRNAALTVAHFYPQLPPAARRLRMQLVGAWAKRRAAIRQRCESGGAHQRNTRTLGQGATLPHALEQQIAEWMRAQTRGGVTVTARMLQSAACALAAERGFGGDIFTASHSWRAGFLRRHFSAEAPTPVATVSMSGSEGGNDPRTVRGDAEQDAEAVQGGEEATDEPATPLISADSSTESIPDGERSDVSAVGSGLRHAQQHEQQQVGGGEQESVGDENVDGGEVDFEPSEDTPQEHAEEDEEMPTAAVDQAGDEEETLASVLLQNGLQQYLPVLEENGFEALDSVRPRRRMVA